MEFIIEVFVFQLLFIGLYLLFNKETFFNYNRAYLLTSSLLSYILPLVKIDFLKQSIIPIDKVNVLPMLFLNSTNRVIENTESTVFVWHWWYVLILGSLVMLTMFLLKLNNLVRLYKTQKIQQDSVAIIELKNSRSAFSFFNWVFLGNQLNEDEKEVILAHELIHVKEKHSWDLLFFEIQRILFWYNPLVYYYQNETKAIHEFVVDEKMIETSGKQDYCNNILTQLFSSTKLSFVNTFYKKSLIKKRIIMITKKESKSKARLKYVFVIPVVVGMLFYTSCQQESTETIIENVVSSDEVKVLNTDYIMNPDGTIEYDVDRITEVKQRIKLLEKEKKASILNSSKVSEGNDIKVVPFAAVQNPAIFPDCEDAKDLKKCFSNKIRKHVSKNFDTGLAEVLGLTGMQRLAAMFKVDTNGDITDIRVRSINEELKQEFERVLNELPEMKPATQNGEKVNMLFSLPLVFRIAEKEKEV